MRLSEYADHDAVGLASLVAAGEVAPRELLDLAIEACEAVNPRINAVIATDFERARRAARADLPDGPFRGVPFLVKDLTVEEGKVTTFGSVFFRNFTAETSATMVSRMLATGLISLGRTSTPEFGLLPTTEPTLFGSTKNPWSLDHSPGGSSGGSAAAVVAGVVPMAHASDGGGSIRIPASACGIFGLKPSRGRMPRFPASAADIVSTDLCVSRSVRDTATMLDATHGAVPGDRYFVAPPDRPFAEAVARDPARLRVAYSLHDLRGERLDDDCIAAVESTATLLDELGHEVIEGRPVLDADALADAFLELWAALAANAFELILAEVGRRRIGRAMKRVLGDHRTLRVLARLDERKTGMPAFEPFTRMLVDRSRRLSQGHYLLTDAYLQTTSYELARFFESCDVWLTPTLGSAPVRIGEIDQSVEWEVIREQVERYVPFTPIANFSGRPAMSVPLHWTGNGLPVGSHFLGEPGAEATLLGLAGQLERARPWWNRRPPSSIDAT
jgi:Asp-tRNA(Asn)/Glu-tRNA(Gln) amidotransferase A subunit family amidase